MVCLWFISGQFLNLDHTMVFTTCSHERNIGGTLSCGQDVGKILHHLKLGTLSNRPWTSSGQWNIIAYFPTTISVQIDKMTLFQHIYIETVMYQGKVGENRKITLRMMSV